ncbi:MAG: hypothetical protein GZ094_02045 [Mariniphaga sp.]|nr:hypothetical protein [Mariniphaga sp.]
MKKTNKFLISPLLIMGAFLILASGCTKVEDTFNPASTVKDIDGNVYTTVTIGTQVWMVENLKTTKYRNGESIANETDTTAWKDLKSGAYCWYNNDVKNKATYGAIYNGYSVLDDRYLAPKGWHIPTKTELTTLTNYLGGLSIAAGKMKESGTTHWSTPNTGATNSSGFKALPGGYSENLGYSTSGINEYGTWWSSTTLLRIGYYDCAWFIELDYSSANVRLDNSPYNFGSSVRCIKD